MLFIGEMPNTPKYWFCILYIVESTTQGIHRGPSFNESKIYWNNYEARIESFCNVHVFCIKRKRSRKVDEQTLSF